ncbi:MAG: DNA gyrase subunit A [Actinobacteria bacterium]|nr:DNA gyrase subunit A [Actinomycetota bacterium]
MPTDGHNQGIDESSISTIEIVEFQDEMERSFLEYAMSVIVARALPDVRDGLKPVHRRILHTMYSQGLRPDRPFSKSARVVGDVMGRFHPHGEAAIYDALARMVQDFSLRYPLISGHGNFGSTGPDEGPAAMRYTECRLSEISLTLLAGIDEDTVDFVPNYDATETEPVVLPSRLPNLLINGSQGIAVGLATNIPPHNLHEIIEAVIYKLMHPDAGVEEIIEIVKGPDFPTGAIILGHEGIHDAYRTGRGTIKLQAVADIESSHTSDRIVITELPYQTSVEVIERRIADLVKSGELEGIARTRNESAGRKPKLVIELKRDVNARVVLNRLFRLTSLQSNFAINMVALVDGVPRTLNIEQLIDAYCRHQIDVVTRRSRYRLNKAKDRAHIVEGLLRAISMLDEVIRTIRAANDRSEARLALQNIPFNFTEAQANHILDMTLARLTRLGETELRDEFKNLQNTIKELESILADEWRLRRVIADELLVWDAEFSDQRRTRILNDTGEITAEDLINEEELVVTLTAANYIKAVSADSFRIQARGGKGVRGTKVKDTDIVTHVAYVTAHSYVLLFSNRGRVFKVRGHEIPSKDRTARGVPVVNVIPVDNSETIQAMVSTTSFDKDKFLLFVTRKGLVKKTSITEYDKSRREGFTALTIREGDELVAVLEVSSTDDIILVSKYGMAIRFNTLDIRASGRTAMGVLGMRLRNNDYVVACDVTSNGDDLLLITNRGFGKRISFDKFNLQNRGGLGVRAMTVSDRRGYVIGARAVHANDEIILVSSDGVTMKTVAGSIAAQGRTASGVRVMQLGLDQQLAGFAPANMN